MLAPPSANSDFRQQLGAALTQADLRARLDELSRLARSGLGFIETLQLDKALASFATEPAANFPAVRVALLSSHTVEHLQPALRVAGLAQGLRLQTQVGTYGQFRQDVLDAASPLHRFKPDWVVLSLSAQLTIAGVPVAATAEDAERAITRAVDELRSLWGHLRGTLKATVVQQTFLDVTEPLFGSFDRVVPGAPSNLVARLNDHVARAAQREQVLLLDVARASARDGLAAWYDVGRWLHGKMEITPQAAGRWGELMARLIRAQLGGSRKCLVLDLDNTVWGGVVGDVGTTGIVLGEGSAQGEAHLALQRYAKRLQERGVILAVCSKNDPALAQAAFRDHPEMVLRLDDIAAFVANWDDKAQNLRQIAERLNIGLDSLVFVDDNPVERARVREALPMVAVPELPADPALYVRCVAEAGYFESTSFTSDDQQRGQQYVSNAQRDSLRDSAGSIDAFLSGLEMVVSFGAVRPVDLTRAAQLINKTNQFNTTTRRYAPDEVKRIPEAAGHLMLQFRLSDRFGDNGLVSVMVLRPHDGADAMALDNWVMSCRVFSRGLEHEAMTIAVEALRARGMRHLHADFVPTERNGVIRNLFAELGFTRVDGPADATAPSRWWLDLAAYAPRPTFMTRKADA